MRKASWVWLINDDSGMCVLVYYYQNPDTMIWGFGFNEADGGGFVPENELLPGTMVVSAIVGTPIEGARRMARRKQ